MLVRPGDRVVYDMATETVIRAVHVGGTLAFSHDKDTLLCAGLIRIAPGGLYYRVKNWDFKVTCENLADKRYFLASQGFPDIIQPGAPRTFTFGAQYRF